MLQSLKNYSTEKIVSLLLSMAGSCSNENLVRMTYLMELIPKKEYYRERIRWFRRLIREGHPSIEFPRRILRDLHPNQRDKWITNLAVNHLLSGTNTRKNWADREGYYPPSTVVISPTMRCNLSCYGCYAGDYGRELELSLEEIDSVLTQMKEMGVYFAVISGGEPFFKEDIFEIFTRHSDMAFLVFTHGGLIDERMVERLISVGNVMPAFSLEGFEKETDARRGSGHFRKVMRAMDLLRRRVVDFRATKPMVMVDFWNDGPLISGCIAGGRKYFHVNANGDIEPCVFCHFAVDNIRRTTLREALKSPLFQAIRSRQGGHENLLRPCMLIDHPDVGRELFTSVGVYPTHEGAAKIFTGLDAEMDEYAGRYAEIADQAWERDFCGEAPAAVRTGARKK